MKSTLNPATTLLFVKLDEGKSSEGSEVVVPYYVNRMASVVARNYLDVVAKSEGVAGQRDNLCLCKTSVYMARFPDREKLPNTGTVVWVRFEDGVDTTEAMCNMALAWSEVFGTDGNNTLISESFAGKSVPLNLIIAEQLPIGPLDVNFDFEGMLSRTS